jgi:hypothetical protein
MDADSDLKDLRSSAPIRGAFAFVLFDSRFAGKGRSRIGQGRLPRQILHTLAMCQVVSWRSTARQHVCRF